MEINRLKSVVHIAFLLNLITKDQIETWAFSKIENGDYDDFFFNLSTSKNNNEVLNVLGEIPSDTDSTLFFVEYFFSFFKNAFKNEIWKIVEEKIVSFYNIVDLSAINVTIKLSLIRIKDDYELRRDGFGGSMDMPSDLIDFLNQFPDLTAVLDVPFAIPNHN